MDTLPLPASPSLEQYQKRAKDLVKAARSAKPDAVHYWASDWLRSLAKTLGGTVDDRMRSLLDDAIATIEKRVRAKAWAVDVRDVDGRRRECLKRRRRARLYA